MLGIRNRHHGLGIGYKLFRTGEYGVIAQYSAKMTDSRLEIFSDTPFGNAIYLLAILYSPTRRLQMRRNLLPDNPL